MASVVSILTGLCLLVMGLTAKIPASGAANTREPQADRAEPARRAVVIAVGMVAVLYGLYRLGH